jgi:hypothetical protein
LGTGSKELLGATVEVVKRSETSQICRDSQAMDRRKIICLVRKMPKIVEELREESL